MLVIMGPNMAKAGDNVTLSCSAQSNPPGIYQWLFNGSVVANTSVYITPPFTWDMSGTYTCVVYNNITGGNSTAHTMLFPLGEICGCFFCLFFYTNVYPSHQQKIWIRRELHNCHAFLHCFQNQ